MSALQGIEWEEPFIEPRRDPELERLAIERLGAAPRALRYYSDCPWLARGVDFRNGLLVHESFELYDRLFLAVSQDNSCRFCFDTQRALMRLSGFSEERIRELERDSSSGLDAGPRHALEIGRKLSRWNPPLTSADLEPLREAGWNDGAIAELLAGLKPTTGAVRWVRPDVLHLTLKFIGHLGEEKLPALREALARVGTSEPVKLEFHGVGFFPNPRSPPPELPGVGPLR